MSRPGAGLACLLALQGLLAGCATQDQVAQGVAASGASFLSAVTPQQAPPGARIQLTGGGFGAAPGSAGQVRLMPGAGMQAIPFGIDSWSDKVIYARVPPIQPTVGYSSVIEVVDSGGGIAFADLPFYVTAAPQTADSTNPASNPSLTTQNPGLSTGGLYNNAGKRR